MDQPQGCMVEKMNTTCDTVTGSRNKPLLDIMNNATISDKYQHWTYFKNSAASSGKVWCTCKERRVAQAGSSAQAHKSTWQKQTWCLIKPTDYTNYSGGQLNEGKQHTLFQSHKHFRLVIKHGWAVQMWDTWEKLTHTTAFSCWCRFQY